MVDEPDGVNEAFESALRVGLTVAGRAAEVLARARMQAARDAEAAGHQHARELQARLDAERSAARASLAPVHRQEWWATAGPEDVAAAWQTARAWSEVDPDAQQAAAVSRDQVRDRYGVDVDDARPDPGTLTAALAAADGAGPEAARRRREQDQLEVAALLAGPDLPPGRTTAPTSVQSPAVEYDTAVRRQGLAASLGGDVDAETVQARVLADTSQARPPQAAVTAAAGRTPLARPARGLAPGAAQERTLSR